MTLILLKCQYYHWLKMFVRHVNYVLHACRSRLGPLIEPPFLYFKLYQRRIPNILPNRRTALLSRACDRMAALTPDSDCGAKGGSKRSRDDLTSETTTTKNTFVAQMPLRGKKRKANSPEVQLRLAIQMAARRKSAQDAYQAYTHAINTGLKLTLDSYATLLYLCSGGNDWNTEIQNVDNNAPPVDGTDGGQSSRLDLYEWGQSLLNDMTERGIKPNEICYTALARMAARKGDAAGALDIAKRVAQSGCAPRLRCFVPALTAFAEFQDGPGAFAVDEEIGKAGLEPGESEFALLLHAAAGGGVAWDRVEDVLRRMGRELTVLEDDTLVKAERCFRSQRDASWEVCAQCTVDADGSCALAGGAVKAIDLSTAEYEDFLNGIEDLAKRHERHPNDFRSFVQWLDANGPFGVVVDAANVAFFGQNFDSGGFNFSQIAQVVEKLRSLHPEKKPLVVLHVARTKSPAAQDPEAAALLERLREEGMFYATPQGSNDDWYWMYAAVSTGSQGLLVSNDEMRDHMFQMLAPRYFGRWKQRHQLRYKFSGSPTKLCFEYPAPYTTCVQQLESGAWMLPGSDGRWLCARPPTLQRV